MPQIVGRNPKVTRQLKQIIEEECALYGGYLQILDQERELLRQMRSSANTDAIMLLTAKRDVFSQEMKVLAERRGELLSVFGDTQGLKLSQLVKDYFHKADVSELMPCINRLKLLVDKSRRKNFEFSQIIGFSLNLVNGLASLFWSASQSVIKCYSPNGKIKESFHPSKSRAASVLKEA